MADLCKDAATNTECLETSRSKISDLRRTLQCLEIELQSQISMVRHRKYRIYNPKECEKFSALFFRYDL